MNNLQQKSVLQPDVVTEIEACLKDRETHLEEAVIEPLIQATAGIVNGSSSQVRDSSQTTSTAPRATGSIARPDKRQIEQRIEEDRERHKRFRESIWAIGRNDDDEFKKAWDECSDFGEEDYIQAEEEATERTLALEMDMAERAEQK